MPLPDPQPGLVISYAYLWRREQEAGRVEGVKNRPCAIVLVTEQAEAGKSVIVVPITHSPPADLDAAIEIPAATKKRMGLDSERSWVVISEVNRFRWPGPDLAPVPGTSDRFDYGFLPPGLHQQIKTRFVERARARKVTLTGRD